MIDDGLQCFILRDGQRPIGFVGMKRLSPRGYSLEKLAVLPEERHNGCGRMLVDHVCNVVADAGGHEIHIGIIGEHIDLKRWYLDLGFRVVDTIHHDHLPFSVCMMEKALTMP